MIGGKTQDWDLIIVGGGIVGCSAAYYAARSGMRVLMVERDTPGSAQSGRNLGFVRQQGRDFRELALAMEAQKIWEGVEAELGRRVGWLQGGYFALAFSDADLAQQSDWQAQARDFGLDTKLLTVDQVTSRLPLLAPSAGAKGAMFTASDGRAEPARATRAFFEAALDLGISVCMGVPVSRIDVSAGRATGVWVKDNFYRSNTVVCAAGTGSGRLLRAVGLDLPQERIRATVVCTEPKPELRLDACVSGQFTGIRQNSEGAFVISVAGGEYDVRPDSWRYMRWYAATRKASPDAARINYWAPLQNLLPWRYKAPLADIPPTRDAVTPAAFRAEQAVSELGRYFPALADVRVQTSWAGIIDTLPDLVPAIGHVDKIEGLLVATGFSGHGFAPGPMAGKIMAELAAGRLSPVDLSGLSPMRFRSPCQLVSERLSG